MDKIPAVEAQALVDHRRGQVRDGQGDCIGEQEQFDQGQQEEQHQRAAVPQDLHQFLVDERPQALERLQHAQSNLWRKVMAARNITTRI